MQQFSNHQELVELKDSKKAVRHDRVHRRPWRQFEALCSGAMGEAAKSGCSRRYLRATRQQSSCTSTSTTRSLKEGRCLRVAQASDPKIVLIMEDK